MVAVARSVFPLGLGTGHHHQCFCNLESRLLQCALFGAALDDPLEAGAGAECSGPPSYGDRSVGAHNFSGSESVVAPNRFQVAGFD